MARPRLFGGLGGGNGAAWVQVTETEQTSDAIVDPDGYTAGTTGLSGGTFTFDLVASTTAIRNGYREAMPRWSVNLETLLPTFDPDVSNVDIGVTAITGLGLGSSTKVGLAAGILNKPADDIGSANGNMTVLYDFNATNHGWNILGATAAAGGGNKTDAGTEFSLRNWWLKHATTPVQHLSGQYLTTTADTWGHDNGMHGYSASMGSTTSEWSIHLALYLGAAATITKTVTCELWVAHTLTAGPT